jgi:hypothetical protein
MSDAVITSIVSAVGGIIIAIITYVISPRIKSEIYRARKKVPIHILGTWKVEWLINGGKYSEDIIEIQKWRRNNTFVGIGYNEKGNYNIYGEVFSSNYIVGFYTNKSYPSKGYLGSFTTKLSIDGKQMKGMWQGTTPKEIIEGGAVTFIKQ